MAIDLVATLRLKDDMTSSLKKVGAVAAVGFGAITAAAAISVNKFVEFDSAIRKTGAIAGANAEELEILSQAALDLGQSTSKGATEVANAMTDLAAAGFSVNDVMGAMPGIIAASEASGESLATASDTVASALNIWSLEAEEATHIADVLAMAANVSAAGIQDLGYAFKYAGAPAAALGVSLEETAAAIGIMSNSGIDGSSAGTALRASLLALNNPAKAQAKLMDKIGFSVTDAEGNFRSLSEIIGALGDSLDGMTADNKVAILGKLVGTEAVSGVLSLISAGTDKLDEMTDALVRSDGAAEATAKQMMGGIGGALEEMGGAFETLQISIGDALEDSIVEFARFLSEMDFQPIIDGAVSVGEAMFTAAQFVIENWDGIISTVKDVTTVILAVTAAVVAFKGIMAGMAVIQTVIALFSAWRAGTLLATAAQLGFNTALWASPITWIAAGIAALIGIIVVLALNWDIVSAKTREFWSAIGGLEGVIRTITGPIGILIGAAIDLAKNWDSTKSVWENVWGAMKRSAAETVNSVIGGINKMIEMINLIPGVNIPIIAKVDWGGNESYNTAAKVAGGTNNRMNLSHYHGLDSVPYDGYTASLHRGETVLDAKEAQAYREGKGGGSSVTITGNQFTVREEADIEKIAYKLAKLIEKEAVQYG